MALTGNKIDLVLGLKLNEFFAANKRAAASYTKTKGSIEKRPIRVKETGTANLLKRLTQIGIAYIGLRKIVTDFTTSQTNLANIASLGVDNIEELGEGIQRIGAEVPVALHDIEQGMYQVVSAGVAASDQINVLELSAKAAKAGLAETTDALNLGSAVIKGYGKTWGEFESVMDQAFQTVKLGQTTFPELATNLGTVIPLAATLKVETEELFGAFATLTGVTGNTSEVATQLRGILAATAKPTKDLTELFKEYGGAAAALQELGLAEYLKVIADETGGNTEQMAKLVPRVEGLNAVIALSGTQFDTFIAKTKEMENSTNAMGEAFLTQADTLESKITSLNNNFQILTTGLLEGVIPAVNDVIDVGVEFFQWFNSLDESTKKATLGISAMIIILPRLAVAFQGLYLALGPAGWLILGLGTLAAVILTAETNLVKLNKELAAFEEKTAELALNELIKERVELEKEFQRKKEEGILITQDEIKQHEFIISMIEQKLEKEEEVFDLEQKKFEWVDGKLVEVAEKQEENIKKTTEAVQGSFDRLQASIGQNLEAVEEFYFKFAEIDSEFTDVIFDNLENEYSLRTQLLDNQLAQVKKTVGEETKEYQALARKKWAIELNYQKRRKQLELEGLKSSLDLGAEFFNAFQGQSRSLFLLGKTAAIAQAIINTYEGASKAVATYPPPISYVMAALQTALGFAQVGKIRATEFQGKAKGGIISDSDVAGFAFTPSGEDGILAAQIGEYVVNRAATRQYYPLLEQINKSGLKGYQQGGRVDQVQPGITDFGNLGAIVQDAIVEGFDNSQLKVLGRINISGNQIQIVLDKTDALKTQIAEG